MPWPPVATSVESFDHECALEVFFRNGREILHRRPVLLVGELRLFFTLRLRSPSLVLTLGPLHHFRHGILDTLAQGFLELIIDLNVRIFHRSVVLAA